MIYNEFPIKITLYNSEIKAINPESQDIKAIYTIKNRVDDQKNLIELKQNTQFDDVNCDDRNLNIFISLI